MPLLWAGIKVRIYRELTVSGLPAVSYRALTSQYYATLQQQVANKPNKIETNEVLKQYIQDHLQLRWSPEQIAQRLKKAYANEPTMHVSQEIIYTYLYVLPKGELKKELLSYLRRKRSSRQKRGQSHQKRTNIPNLISIEEKSQAVAERTVPGHWEGDLIVDKDHKSALGTLVERTSRTTILVPLKEKDAKAVRKAFAKELKSLPEQMKVSLTYDRGSEMSEHELFTKQTKMQVYFAHPQSPWERGTNENTNGLVRQFFPKGTDFTKVTRKEIKRVQDLLNGRPRKVLDWQLPFEVCNDLLH